MEILAVTPARGRVVHLHSPDYQPGLRERPLGDRVGMCGIPIWPNGRPLLPRQLVPLADALKWTSLATSDTDPRPTWMWCKACIGHAVVAAGLHEAALGMVADEAGVP